MADINIIGRAYRIWNASQNKYEKYSFWTKAADVEMDSGINLETQITNLNTSISSLDTNKQAKTDNSLNTSNKNIVGAINEVLGKANNKVKVNGTAVTTVNFALNGTTLTITTS